MKEDEAYIDCSLQCDCEEMTDVDFATRLSQELTLTAIRVIVWRKTQLAMWLDPSVPSISRDHFTPTRPGTIRSPKKSPSRRPLPLPSRPAPPRQSPAPISDLQPCQHTPT